MRVLLTMSYNNIVLNIRAMAKIGYTRSPDGQKRVPPSTLVPVRHLIGQRPPRPDSGRILNGSTRFWLLTPHRLPDFNHTYPIMAGLFDQQPTRARAHADASSRHRGTRRGIFVVDVVVRAAEL